MNYSNKTAVQNYLLTTIDVSFDGQLNEWLTAMSAFMDSYCNDILVETTPTTRLYDGNGESILKIDSVNTITAVTIGSVTITPFRYPANSARKHTLDRDGDRFSVGKQNVAVTGIFARFTIIPADIKFACTVLVAGIVNQANKQTDGIKSEKVGEYTVTYKDEKERADYARAMTILDTHRRVAF